MAKSIFKIIAVFVIGTVGGIFADQILWPYFIERPLFHEYRLEQSPVYVTEKTKTTLYIQENLALREAVEEVAPAVVGVKTETLGGNILEGAGVVLTSDGFIVTLASMIPTGSDFYFFVDDKWPAYQVLKRDSENDLALIKLEMGGFKTRGFADMEKTKLAEPVFLVGMDFSQPVATTTKQFLTSPEITVNQGIITSLNENIIQTNISETQDMSGSTMFNIEGEVVGLSVVGKDGEVSAVPITIIRAFAGF